LTSRLPVISGAEAIKALEKAGWRKVRQRGSHAVLRHPTERFNLSVPLHRELKPGTLRSLLRKSGLSVDEFLALLD